MFAAMLAVVGDTSYNIVLFGHVLTAFVAMSPLFTLAVLARLSRQSGWADRPAMFATMAQRSMAIYGSSLIITGLLGFALAGLSDKAYSMSQFWLASSFVIWIAMNGVLHGLILPSQRVLGASPQGNEAAETKLERGGQLMTLLFLAMLYLMVFQPGVN